ncbi:MAG: hypothetical protein JNJ83_08530 [Verrucomicrobiaceae bacterium]|nr:hypothetical protein [Verrucomicrobiaceae bacterium]
MAILILGVPVLLAAALTPDKFSGRAAVNKGLYSPNYADTSRAEQFTLRKEATKEAAKPTQKQTAAVTQDTPPGTVVNPDGITAKPTDQPPATAAKAGSPPPAKSSSQSFGEFTLEDLKQQVPMSKDGNFVLEVPELFYTAGDLEVQKVLAGQPIETIAQVMPEKVNNADGKRLRILRLLVQCCAADARPYSVPVEFDDKAPTFKDMTWVKVVGKMGYEKEGDQTIPLVKVSKIEETTAPDQSMLY